MKQEEMLSQLRLIFASRYKQVSTPQYYQGQGPYLMTLDETYDTYEFHCYEITDAEIFLSAPEQFSVGLDDPEFLFKVADTLNLQGVKDSGRYFLMLSCIRWCRTRHHAGLQCKRYIELIPSLQKKFYL